MQRIEIPSQGETLIFMVDIMDDDEDSTPPWERDDTHGVVHEPEHRTKKPHERILGDKNNVLGFFDVKATTAKARAFGWTISVESQRAEEFRLGRPMTYKEKIAKVVEEDFDQLQAWCRDEWKYRGAIVTLLDYEGNTTNVFSTMCGLPSDGDIYGDIQDMAEQLASERGVTWDRVERPTYRMFPRKDLSPAKEG